MGENGPSYKEIPFDNDIYSICYVMAFEVSKHRAQPDLYPPPKVIKKQMDEDVEDKKVEEQEQLKNKN